ncbi:MAG: Maf family nucleotide pyrophosphatase [Prevotellaceae bacterium]|jgi:septum formation protein|nr:Maf family nucleotide pyrophosphatase [Prevotellaceae bacterium]
MEGIKLILASQSPRRKELIKGLDIPVEIADSYDFDESYPPTLPADEVAVYLAEKKSDACPLILNDNEVLVTADTLVKCNGELLGKPCNGQQAREMLRKLSGNKHEVITGVCLRTTTVKKSFGVKSSVFFYSLTYRDIEYYVEKYNPADKAGAYGIQEWIGYIGIEKIEGSFYNIMGLPVARLWKELNIICSTKIACIHD